METYMGDTTHTYKQTNTRHTIEDDGLFLGISAQSQSYTTPYMHWAPPPHTHTKRRQVCRERVLVVKGRSKEREQYEERVRRQEMSHSRDEV